ncbi:MAG: hypothetical protein AB1Z98_15315 [Nannocystaceae bacterium]
MNTNPETSETESPAIVSDEVVESYNKIVEMVSLVEVRLSGCEGRFDYHLGFDLGDDGLSLEIAPPAYRVGIEEHGLQAGARFEVDIVARNVEDKNSPLIRVAGEYIVTYDLQDTSTYSVDAIQLFLQRNGIFNAWPFFRELVHSTVSRMGMPPAIVPLLKLPPSPPGIPPLFR